LSCNEGDKINNCKPNSELFSNYFLTNAEQITHIFNSNKINCNNNKNPVHYLSWLFKNPFPEIKFSNASTKEIEKIISSLQSKNRACCGAVGEVLHYKPEGHRFNSRWCQNFSSHTMVLGSTHSLTEMSTRDISKGRRWPVHKADNLTTFMCQLSTIWNPQGLYMD